MNKGRLKKIVADMSVNGRGGVNPMSTTKYVFFLRGEKDAKYSETSKYVFGTYFKFFSSKLFHSVSIDMHIEKGNMDFLSVSTKMVFCIFGEARKMQTIDMSTTIRFFTPFLND